MIEQLRSVMIFVIMSITQICNFKFALEKKPDREII